MKAIILRRKGCGEKLEEGMEEISGAKVVRNDHEIPVADLVFRWGTTSDLPGSPKVINCAKAIHRVFDKRGFRLMTPDLVPKTWGSLYDYALERPQGVTERLLVRPGSHKRSEGMFVCTSLSELVKACNDINGPLYISELIEKQKEYRVFVAQDRVAWVIEKLPKDKSSVSWGCVEQGDFKYVAWTDWPLEVLDSALRATSLGGLHFGAVDVVVGRDGRPYVLEINTAPHLSPYYMKTIGKVFKYMVQENHDISLGGYENDWKSMIHPAVKDF